MKTTLLVLALSCPALLFGDIVSGPQVSDPAGPFTVVKCGGASDGVEPGTELCYRSKYGSDTQVIVFARDPDAIVDLAKQLDQLVAGNAGIHAFVNVLGKDPVDAETAAAGLGEKAGLKKVPVTVPLENENGPASYSLSPKAGVTVLVIRDGVVAANHSAETISGDLVSSVIASAQKAAR